MPPIAGKQTKLPVTVRAAKLRISKALKAEDKSLRLARGRFFIVDHSKNLVTGYDDLTTLGRECGAVHEWEVVEADGD